jgi:hypothetical protein
MTLTDEQRAINRAIACKKYRDQHKTKYSEYNKNYYQANKERIKEKRRQRRLVNKEVKT